MTRLVKDYEAIASTEHYIVKKVIGDGFPMVSVYDNRTGTKSEYFGICEKPVRKVKAFRDHYELYI